MDIHDSNMMEELGYRSGYKKPKSKENSLSKLSYKHGVINAESAVALEQGFQAIIDLLQWQGMMEGLNKASKIYFAQKLEFAEKFKRNEVESLWDYYMTKDEIMNCYRKNKSFGRYRYDEKAYNWDLIK